MDDKYLQEVRKQNSKSRKSANQNNKLTFGISSMAKSYNSNSYNMNTLGDEDINEVNSLNNISSMVSMDSVDTNSMPTSK